MTVVKYEHVPGAGQSFGNPVSIVLDEKLLIASGASAIDLRITPAVEDITPFSAPPAGVPGSFGRRGGVIDNPDFAEVVNADHDLVEPGVVVDSVHVSPIGATAAAAAECSAEWTGAAAPSRVAAERLLRRGCATNFTASRRFGGAHWQRLPAARWPAVPVP